MPTTPLNLSTTNHPRQIQENLIAYMRLFAGLPNVDMVDRATFWIASHRPAPGNSILRSGYRGGDFDAWLDQLFDEVGQHVDEISWLVFPHDQPGDLNQRLAARGMPGGPAGNWLWADLTTLGFSPSVSEHFHIRQVRDDAMMAEWLQASEAGFEMELGWFYDAYARHGYRQDAFSLHYTGYLDNIPVTSGTLLDAGGGAAIYDVSTLPAYRGQGFGGAITHAMMRKIRQKGYADTFIWSSGMAVSVYEQLGFVAADFGIREHVWRRVAD